MHTHSRIAWNLSELVRLCVVERKRVQVGFVRWEKKRERERAIAREWNKHWSCKVNAERNDNGLNSRYVSQKFLNNEIIISKRCVFWTGAALALAEYDGGVHVNTREHIYRKRKKRWKEMAGRIGKSARVSTASACLRNSQNVEKFIKNEFPFIWYATVALSMLPPDNRETERKRIDFLYFCSFHSNLVFQLNESICSRNIIKFIYMVIVVHVQTRAYGPITHEHRTVCVCVWQLSHMSHVIHSLWTTSMRRSEKW